MSRRLKHVDPASREFTLLPREQQARIYAGMGWTIDALMDEFCASQSTIEAWLERVERPSQSMQTEKRARLDYSAIYKLMDQGARCREIARKTGIPQATVSRAIQKRKTQGDA